MIELQDRHRIEEYLREELRIVNIHLPYARKTLSELLKEEFPHVILRDGSFHYFKRSELELLAQLLPTSKWDRLRLPILIEITPEYGEGAAVIKDDIEAEVVAKLLGIDLRVPLIIYRPQISILRRRLPTATQYVFSLRILVEK